MKNKKTEDAKSVNEEKNKKSEDAKSVNEEKLSGEYYRAWLELPLSVPLQRLIMHPLLQREDQDRIDKYMAL